MKYFKAILITLSLIANVTHVPPIFMQWYMQQTGIKYMANIGIFLMCLIIAAGQFVLVVIFWISAITDKSVKEIID